MTKNKLKKIVTEQYELLTERKVKNSFYDGNTWNIYVELELCNPVCIHSGRTLKSIY